MDQILASLMNSFAVPSAVLVPLMVVWGLCSLLFGYRLFRVYLFLCGFAAGFCLSAVFFADAQLGTLQHLFVGAICGCVCIVLWYVGLFLAGFAVGALLPMMLGVNLPPLSFVLGILCGVLAIVFRKFMIILSTSWSGAECILLALQGLVAMNTETVLALHVVLAGAGVVLQYTVLAAKPRVVPGNRPAPARPPEPAAPAEPAGPAA